MRTTDGGGEKVQIGRRIYYDTATGNVLLDTGERQGDVVETTPVEDFAVYPQLKGIDPSTVSHIDLDYGAQADQFASGYVSNVDPTMQTLTFTAFSAS